MARVLLAVTLALVGIATAKAQGASFNLTVVAGPSSTGFTTALATGSPCTLSQSTLACSLPAPGQPLLTFTVQPSTWTGLFVPSGPSVADFTTSAVGNVVTLSAGATAWTNATCPNTAACSLTLTAAP